MAEGFEKYTPNRINKDVAPDSRFPNGDRMFLPGDLLDAENCRYKASNGAVGLVESIPGNILKDTGLPAGTNKTIGRFINTKSNTVIFCVWNSNLDHRVFEWNADTGVFTTLLYGSSLLFDKDHLITQGGCIDDVWVSNDAFNSPRSISIAKARAGGYSAPYSKYQLSLATKPPLAPTVTLLANAELTINRIYDNTWQFACQYIYHDDRASTFSSLSKLVWVRPYENFDIITNGVGFEVSTAPGTDHNTIRVAIALPLELNGVVKRINFAFRKGNTGDYFIFSEINNPIGGVEYTTDFTNNGRATAVSKDDQLRIYDYIPKVTSALEIIENRVFTPLNKTGFNIDDSTFDLAITLGAENTDDSYPNAKYLKEGGVYSAGIVFEDDYGKRSFVKKSKSITVPYYVDPDDLRNYTFRRNNRKFIQWSLTGTPPPGFSRYHIVLTKNKFQAIHFQTYAAVHYYVREISAVDGNDNATHGYYLNWRGKVFLNLGASEHLNETKFVYIQTPINIPVVVTAGYFVRFLIGPLVNKVYKIIDVMGDFLVIEAAPEFLTHTVSPTPSTFWDYAAASGIGVEIFKPTESEDVIFYETGNHYPIQNDQFTTLNGNLEGDTYVVTQRGGGRRGTFYGDVSFSDMYESGENVPMGGNWRNVINGQWFQFPTETPSPIYSTRGVQSVTIGETPSGADTGLFRQTVPIATFDYNKIAADYGIPHTIFNEREIDIYSTFGFSNPYIQNSFINGLNSFLAENQYPLAIERGPVRGAIKVSGVLIAVHERFTSSLYIGEGFMRQGADTFILAKTETVVGDDRELASNYGTINPESLIRVYNLAFWWDGLQGAVVQYSQAGLYPISNYGMENYFFRKSREYYPYRNQIKVITGFDYLNGELLITFPEVKNEFGGVIIAGETWAFNLKSKEWVTRYRFIPELYASLNTDLVSFKDGKLWLHNVNPIHNNFYGVQYTRKYRFACNPQPAKPKKGLNIHIEGELCTDPTSDTFSPVKVYTKEGQESHTPAGYFDRENGKWVGPILKDINTPNLPAEQLPLLSGDDMVSNYLEIEVENDRTDKAQVSEINVIFNTEEFSI